MVQLQRATTGGMRAAHAKASSSSIIRREATSKKRARPKEGKKSKKAKRRKKKGTVELKYGDGCACRRVGKAAAERSQEQGNEQVRLSVTSARCGLVL